MSLQKHYQDSKAEILDSFLLPPTVSNAENDVLKYNDLTTSPIIGVPSWPGINSESRIWLHCECTYADGSPGIIKLAEAVPVGTSTDTLAFSCELPLDELSKLGDNTSLIIVLMASTNGALEKEYLSSVRYSLMFQHPITLTNYSRWMTEIGPSIEHLPVHDLILPETHNAGVDQQGAGWPTDQWAACQDDTFTYQLRNGVRAFDLRLYRDSKEMYTHKEYRFEHSGYHSRRYLNDCIHGVLEFAEQNPGEIVILDFHTIDLGYRERDAVNTIEYVLGKRCIPNSARLYTIGRIRQQHPGRNVIVALNYSSWFCWPKIVQTWTGNDFNNAQELRRHIIEKMTNPPVTNKLWSIFAAGYNILGPVRYTPQAAHWSSFFDATKSNVYRDSTTKGNLINIDFFAGTGAVDRCINATRERAVKASTSTPIRFTAENITTHSIRLKWERPLDNEPIRDYQILEDGKIVSDTRVTEYVVTGLNDGTTYNFEVRAFFASGYGAAAFISATTIGIPDTTKPSKPNDLKFVYFNNSSVALLSWSAATDNVAVTHYEIYRNGIRAETIDSKYTFCPVTAGAVFTYKVRALDAAGNFADSDPLTMAPDQLPPSKPTNLKAVDTTVNSITLEWSSSSDNVGVTGYQVYRNNTLIETVNNAVYTDRGLNSDTNYHYKVRALDAAGNFTDSDPLTARTAGEASPTKPTNLRILIDGTFSALFWNSPTDSARIVSYEIYRNGKQLGTSKHAPGSITQVFFPEDIVTPYSFRVRALDTSGNHTDSDPLTGP